MTTTQKARPSDRIDWLRAHRIGLAPVYLAIPILLAGIGACLSPSTMLVALVLASFALASAAWIASRVSGWRKPYWSGIVAATIGWVIWAATLTTALGWIWAVGVLLSGSALIAIPHWVDRVKRTQVTMEAMIANWSVRGARIGLGKTQIAGMEFNALGNWSAKISWAPGEYLVDDVKKRQLAIEAALNLDQGQLDIEYDGKSNNSMILVATLNDPHASGVMWEIPTQETPEGLQVQTLHGGDEFEVGVRTDGTRKKLRLFKLGWGARQLLIAGIKGSGKSGLLNRIWAHASLCDDVVQWGVDLKGGAELGPWHGVFDWIVTTRAEAIQMIHALDMIVERRNKLLAKYGWKHWQGSPEHPWLLFSVDEARKLLGDANSAEQNMIANIATTARSAGVAIIWSTQYPTLEALGTTQIREQIDQRFCFRMADVDGEGYVLGGEHRVNAHKISSDRPGTCYHVDGDKLDSMPMRVLFVGDGSGGTRDLIKIIVGLLTGKTPVLDRDSIESGIDRLEAYANRDRENENPDRESQVSERDSESGKSLVLPDFPENVDVPLADVVSRFEDEKTPEQREAEQREREAQAASEKPRLDDDAARVALVTALREAGPVGISASELAEAATRQKTWTYDRLKELEEAGHAARNASAGTWVAVLADHMGG